MTPAPENIRPLQQLRPLVAGIVAALALLLAGCGKPVKKEVYEPRPPGTITFAKDIAPIVFQNCSYCHRPDQSAPFSLLEYQDVKKRAKQIAEVTEDRYMPPWLPEPGYAEFMNPRTLTVHEIGLIQQWVAEGSKEGDPGDLPRLPKWPENWPLGEPDLVVTMPEPFTLRADGPDVYRNFVTPLPLESNRYVRAVEFRPGNSRIVHHAFIKFDATKESRERDALDPEPGFDGIHAPSSAHPPDGHFLSWQPGRIPYMGEADMAWELAAGADLVLQLHLQPTGKPEQIQSRVGFYFSERAPTRKPLKIWLNSYNIDIPAGATNHPVEESYTLSADVDVLGVLPHAHFLAKEVHGVATLPDGGRKWLIRINDWDFDWQGDYRYAEPLFLPRGTTIAMRYFYDNSANNLDNPNHPPQRVRYGIESSDEMAELWLQVLPRHPEGRAALQKDAERRVLEDALAYNRYLLDRNPNDAQAHTGMGKALYLQGRGREALEYLQRALQLKPSDEAHYYTGLSLRQTGQRPAAIPHLQAALRFNPDHAKAHGNLGLVYLEGKDLVRAEFHLRQALQRDPKDAIAHDSLGIIYAQRGDLDRAEAHFRIALQLAPADALAKQHLETLLRQKGGR